MIMKKLANYLWVEKVGEQYVYSMTQNYKMTLVQLVMLNLWVMMILK